MIETVDQAAACMALGVDAWGLERLISLGELEASGEPGARVFEAPALEAYADQRRRRQAEAFSDLAGIDGPHLGGER
jgi:hypothetical protein